MNDQIAPNLEREFKLANVFAMSGWLCLMLLPTWQHTSFYVLNIAFVLLALLYIYLLQRAARTKPQPGEDKPSFSTLRGVMALLKSPEGGLTAWVHILAFDLMVGFYIHQEGSALGMSHWLLLPCYFLALMLGPVGLLLFLILKFATI